MNQRNSRPVPSRAPVAPIHRGPQALAAPGSYGGSFVHAPNAALLIDFDNVTMGIRSDLGNELRTLLSSDIIKGKVAVQRAYADWRRYPQYIVPLTEASIDLIWAPAYGSSKKNATDIRLAIDALELVFTRPEIGTIILLSGDSDFSSLVIKLKEYGKYVIGVGIRESSSDLLVMNCDEYYSYNALAGLVKSGEEEHISRDPWELVVEAVRRMKRNGDVMRSDRLKQVMQDIDSSFDERNLGMAKFSRFVQEAAQRGLLKLARLENGQMEVDLPSDGAAPPPAAEPRPLAARTKEGERQTGEQEGGRRGRRGRGRERRERGAPSAAAAPAAAAEAAHFAPPLAEPVSATPGEMGGERLRRDEALELVRSAVHALAATEDEPVAASAVRLKARELLGRDSESLNDRFFHRILRDAHDANVIDLRKRGTDYEVAPFVPGAPIETQLAAAAQPPAEPSHAARSAMGAAALRRGIRQRGTRPSRQLELPPELLSIGVIEPPPEPEPAPSALTPSAEVVVEAPEPAGERAAKTAERAPSRRGRRGGKGAQAKRARKAAAPSGDAGPSAEAAPPPKPRRPRARKKKSAAPAGGEE